MLILKFKSTVFIWLESLGTVFWKIGGIIGLNFKIHAANLKTFAFFAIVDIFQRGTRTILGWDGGKGVITFFAWNNGINVAIEITHVAVT